MNEVIKAIRELYWSGNYTFESFLPVLNMETRDVHALSQIVRGERFEELAGPKVGRDPLAALRGSEFDLSTVINHIRLSYPALTIEELASRYNLAPIHVRKLLSGEIAKYMPNKFPLLAYRPCPQEGLDRLREVYLENEDEFRGAIFGSRGFGNDNPEMGDLGDNEARMDNSDYPGSLWAEETLLPAGETNHEQGVA